MREELERITGGQLEPPAEGVRKSEYPPLGRRPTSAGVGGEILAQLARMRQTQTWLAEQTGMPIATLSRHLRAPGRFRLEELLAIAYVLGLEPAALLAR
ncbi:helix-turn-helix domain-containing protein [Curtobacterium sp. TXMA1]|uniref:helix-turn-helix domain-containing protein n=1 Tax=Curtobacterium sp. TXMA1 TaxID=2876939 RepID=UPI001CCDDC5E|nr:helix-turn-helix transcriptional regulator [Curtobacterium sp. TXMA1]UBQ02757.1 helix-turn-helix transcriptional regulator [Curtobacterium sp. TXMA1]